MRIFYNNVVDTARRVIEVDGDRVTIGRDDHNDLVLPSPYIASEAMVLYRRGAAWEVVVLGMNGIQIDGEQVSAGQHREITKRVSIESFPFTLTVVLPTEEELSRNAARERLNQNVSDVIAEVHRELLDRMDLRRGVDVAKQNDQVYQLTLERHIETIATSHAKMNNPESDLICHLAGCALRNRLLSMRSESNASPLPSTVMTQQALPIWAELATIVPERERELTSTTAFLVKTIETDGGELDRMDAEQIESEFWNAWADLESRVHQEFKTYLALALIKKDIKDIIFGYGPLEDLLRMPSISEIMVVDRDHVFVETNGQIEDSGRRFISDEIVESIIQRIVGRVGRRIDKSRPLVDARLADGSRVNAVIAPLAVSGPTLTIRKFPDRKILIHDLVAMGSFTHGTAEFLRALVLSRKNILVSGGTGTGKTTLLNCLSDFIPNNERIVTIEDTAELQLAKDHVVRMETKNANIEGAGEYTIRDLVKNSLRMRPDRIVVGECRGPEALDMLQAMNTGHDGSLTTIHANNSHDVSLRLEVLVQMAADLPVASIRQQVASAIDVVIQLQRCRDGRRVISQITECVRVSPIDGALEMRDLFELDPVDGQLHATGQLPTFIDELLDAGQLNLDAFYQTEESLCS
jgi:Flp pilus assembly CpaF family ATPase